MAKFKVGDIIETTDQWKSIYPGTGIVKDINGTAAYIILWSHRVDSMVNTYVWVEEDCVLVTPGTFQVPITQGPYHYVIKDDFEYDFMDHKGDVKLACSHNKTREIPLFSSFIRVCVDCKKDLGNV